MRTKQSTVRAGAIFATAVTLAFVPATATAATLIPAPGTGHGVLSQTTPAEERASLEYSPAFGGPPPTGRCDATPPTAGPARHGIVGASISICIGEFPVSDVEISVTPPRGPTIAVGDQPVPSTSAGFGFTMSTTPGPPDTRYQITDKRGLAAAGKLKGDGSGTYTVRAKGGGASSTTEFVLDPAPIPRLTSLGSSVAPGKRLRFGAAGQKPLATFLVVIFGPEEASGLKRSYSPRTVVTARADKKGEAVIVLDTLASCPTGEFMAVLDSKPSLDTDPALNPLKVTFWVTTPEPDQSK